LGTEGIQEEYGFSACITYRVGAWDVRLDVVDWLSAIDPFFWEEVIIIEQCALRV
jgi:hypothetical protein